MLFCRNIYLAIKSNILTSKALCNCCDSKRFLGILYFDIRFILRIKQLVSLLK